MSVCFRDSTNPSYVSGNQFTTMSDQLKGRINAIDQQIDDMNHNIDFVMNNVGDLKSKSEKMIQAFDDMSRTFYSDHIRIQSLDTMVDTDHYLYFDSLITRARLPQDVNYFTIFVAPNGEVFWANNKPKVSEEFGLATYFTEDQFIKLMQCEYKLEQFGEYDCRWQMLFANRTDRSWWTRSAYRLYNLLPVEGSSVGKSSYCYNEHPEECDYPLFPFDKPGYTDKEIEKICEKLFQNKSYQNFSNESGFLVYFTTLKDGGYVEAIIENEFYKLGSKTCYYFN